MKVAVLQSNYIPWKGYFDIIHDVDLFVFYDDVQFTKNDWRNRNLIKKDNGPAWITIPVGKDLNRRICDVELEDTKWAKSHFLMLKQYYGKAKYFANFERWLENLYLNTRWEYLSDLNQFIIKHIANNFLNIKVRFDDSRNYHLTGKSDERLLSLLEQVGATYYVSGPSGQSYIDENKFNSRGIELAYKDYANYPEYFQYHEPFSHNVTIFDLLFHTGPDASYYIWGWRAQ